MAMPQCCYLAKGAKRPSHTNTIKVDRIPFDLCNSIKRFGLCPFDQKNSTYLQPPVKGAVTLNFPGASNSFIVFLSFFWIQKKSESRSACKISVSTSMLKKLASSANSAKSLDLQQNMEGRVTITTCESEILLKNSFNNGSLIVAIGLLNSFRDGNDLNLRWTTSLTLFCWFVAALGLKEPSQPGEIIPLSWHINNSINSQQPTQKMFKKAASCSCPKSI